MKQQTTDENTPHLDQKKFLTGDTTGALAFSIIEIAKSIFKHLFYRKKILANNDT